MRKLGLPGVFALITLSTAVHAQAPSAGALFNRLSASYRAMQSYHDHATWTRKTGGKDMTATIEIALERPNRYLLDVKGEKVNTIVVSDGRTLVGYRVDRNAYTKVRAPQFLRGTDILADVDLPMLGARIISLMLQSGAQTTDNSLVTRIAAGKVSETLIDNKPGYLLTFRYDLESDARIYISDEKLIRRVSVLKDGAVVMDEKHDVIETDKPIPASTFVKTVPENARPVAVLPALNNLGSASAEAGPPAPDFTVQTADGGTVTLSKLKGKVVLLNFFFNT